MRGPGIDQPVLGLFDVGRGDRARDPHLFDDLAGQGVDQPGPLWRAFVGFILFPLVPDRRCPCFLAAPLLHRGAGSKQGSSPSCSLLGNKHGHLVISQGRGMALSV